MRDLLSERSDLDLLQMLVGNSQELAIMLEGPDDLCLLSNVVNSHIHLLVSSSGKRGVLRAAESAIVHGISRALFVVDRDYDDFLPESPTYPSNVVVSTHHDCFVDVLVENMDSLTHVIATKLSSYARRSGSTVGDARGVANVVINLAISLARCKAVVRIVAARMAIGFNFTKFSYYKYSPNVITSDLIYADLADRYVGMVDLPSDPSIILAGVALELDNCSYVPFGDHDFLEALCRVLNEHGVCMQPDTFREAVFMTLKARDLLKARWCDDVAQRSAALGVSFFSSANTQARYSNAS